MQSTLSTGLDGPAPRLNALTTKITTLLSTSLASIEIRDSLSALDARGIHNTSSTRRNLRLDLQSETISSNATIISDFGTVASQLRSVGAALSNLQNTVAEMRSHVLAAKLETTPMLDEADALLAKQEQVETKKALLRAFTTHFVLSESELLVLTSTAEPVNDEFFAALVKAKKIHKDSQVLLGGENQRLGLEILEQSSKHLNAAFQKLYRWVQREFKTLDLENPQLNASIRRAVRVLAERPALFQSALDAFAEARDRTLSDAFYGALTGGAATRRGDESARPIEFSMHEPLRYVGDMLAWVHSTAVSERETLEGLFVSEGDEIARGIREGLESEPWSHAGADEAVESFDGRKTLGRLVDRGLHSAAQLLKQRVEQLLQSQADAVLAYKVFNLIAFYGNIFTRLVESADLMSTLSQMQHTALSHFRTAMRAHLATIAAEATVPHDLSAPDFLQDALEQLRTLLTSYETSAVSASASDGALSVVLEEALTPFTTLCSELAATLPSPLSAVFVVNCTQAARTALLPFRTFAAPAIADLDTTISSSKADLQDFLDSFMLERSGLASLVDQVRALDGSPDDTEAVRTLLSSADVFEHALRAAAQQLDAFLPSAIGDAEEQVGRLRDKTMVAHVVGSAADGFRRVFEEVVDWVEAADEVRERERDVKEGTERGEIENERLLFRETFPRTSEEVEILLS